MYDGSAHFHQTAHSLFVDVIAKDGADAVDDRLGGIVPVTKNGVQRHEHQWKAFKFGLRPGAIEIFQ